MAGLTLFSLAGLALADAVNLCALAVLVVFGVVLAAEVL